MSANDNLSYRAEIDGLRAVAVLAVVLFHAGFSCHGGYVGVDVFFVISGFLITSLIWRDLETGRFSFARFWEKRARRIVPVMVLITLATLAVGWILLMPLDFKKLGHAAAAQSLFAANFHYWRDSGYFTSAASGKALLHMWSLAVEEQFYLIVPFLMWGVFHHTSQQNRRTVGVGLLLVFLLSFVMSCIGVYFFPVTTYFLLPTRAWELALGSLVAFLPVEPALLYRRRVRELCTLAGLILILLPVFCYTAKTPFPGLAALPPCFGTALLIWANNRREGHAPSTVGKLLSLRPIVFVGLISYSLYLWHWPILVLSKYATVIPLSARARAGLVGVACLLSILSWKYVETPIRARRVLVSRRTLFLSAGTGLVMVLVAGLLCLVCKGFPSRISTQAQAFANAANDVAFQNQLTTEDLRAGRVIAIGSTNSTWHPSVLVWGDSHAMAALPAVDAFLKENALSGCAATHSSTAPVLDWFMRTEWGVRDAIAYNAAVMAYIRTQHIPNVLLVARWGSYVGKTEQNTCVFEASLLATVRRLAAAGAHPWVLLDVPMHSFNVPLALALSTSLPVDVASACARPTAGEKDNDFKPQIIAAIEAAGGSVLNPKPRFLDPSGNYYMVQASGSVLYRDEQHLTVSGARKMLLPLFRDLLKLKD